MIVWNIGIGGAFTRIRCSIKRILKPTYTKHTYKPDDCLPLTAQADASQRRRWPGPLHISPAGIRSLTHQAGIPGWRDRCQPLECGSSRDGAGPAGRARWCGILDACLVDAPRRRVKSASPPVRANVLCACKNNELQRSRRQRQATSRSSVWVFSLRKRLLWPAFADHAHCSFLTFFSLFFQCAVMYLSTPHSQVTLPALLLGYSGRFVRPIVCLVPAERDRNSAYSAGTVAARRQNGVAVPHKGRRLEVECVGERARAGDHSEAHRTHT